MSSVLAEHDDDPHVVGSQKRKFDDIPVDSGVIVAETSRWYPSSIIVEARTFDGTAVNADLMTVIGRGVKANKCTLSERYYLPSQYNQNNAEYRAKTIAPIFASACACAGCEVRLKGWEKSKGFLKFVCPQYRRYKSTSKQQQQLLPSTPGAESNISETASPTPPDVVDGPPNSLEDFVPTEVVTNGSKKGKTSNRAISRPMDKESTCPFSFLVFWEEYSGQENVASDARKGRWFICATGAGTPYHEGHSRKEFTQGELRRKQLQVEGAYDILMPYYKKIVELVDRDEDKLNQAIGRLSGLIEGLKRQQHQPLNGTNGATSNNLIKMEMPLGDNTLDMHHDVRHQVLTRIKSEPMVDDDNQNHEDQDEHQDVIISSSAEAAAAALLDQSVMNEEVVNL